MGRWQQTSSKIVHQNPYYFVRQDEVIRPDGKPGTFYVVDGRTVVFIVAVNNEGKILLERIYRYTTQEESLEVMAGGIDEGEDPLTAAKRELKEETGYTAEVWEELGTTKMMPGISTIQSHTFFCSSLHQTNNHLQTEEGITAVTAHTKEEIIRMIASGEINGQATIGAIMLAIAREKI